VSASTGLTGSCTVDTPGTPTSHVRQRGARSANALNIPNRSETGPFVGERVGASRTLPVGVATRFGGQVDGVRSGGDDGGDGGRAARRRDARGRPRVQAEHGHHAGLVTLTSRRQANVLLRLLDSTRRCRWGMVTDGSRHPDPVAAEHACLAGAVSTGYSKFW
jgi:hypothetical protein